MPLPTNHNRLFWTLNLCGWLAFGVAMTFSRPGRYALGYMLVNKSILMGLGIGVSVALRAIYRPLKQRTTSLWALLTLSVVCSYFASLGWTAGHQVGVAFYEAGWSIASLQIPPGVLLINGALYHAFVLVSWSVLYFGINYYLDLQRTRETMLQAEAAAHQARLRALRYQLNPHFLFNSLNAVSTLITEHDNDAAKRMLVRLSDFLRLTLDAPDTTTVPLAQELDYAERYLAVERVRFGERLHVVIDADADTLTAAVPTLLLQPLVENAVRYGISPRLEGGTLSLEARKVAERLLLRIQDDGPGLSQDITEGVGLTNTRLRLAQRYGDDHRFELRRADGGGLLVVIELPFEPAAFDALPHSPTEAHAAHPDR